MEIGLKLCDAELQQLHTKEQIMIEKHDEAQNGFLHCINVKQTLLAAWPKQPMNKTNE